MPTIAQFSNCSIKLYAADHLPPHFHIRMRDGREVLVAITNLCVLRGSVPVRPLTEALDWAAAHRTELLTKWRELNP